jgi:hypothetical protein
MIGDRCLVAVRSSPARWAIDAAWAFVVGRGIRGSSIIPVDLGQTQAVTLKSQYLTPSRIDPIPVSVANLLTMPCMPGLSCRIILNVLNVVGINGYNRFSEETQPWRLAVNRALIAQSSSPRYCGFPIRWRKTFPAPRPAPGAGRLEVGDTAGWKPAPRAPAGSRSRSSGSCKASRAQECSINADYFARTKSRESIAWSFGPSVPWSEVRGP